MTDLFINSLRKVDKKKRESLNKVGKETRNSHAKSLKNITYEFSSEHNLQENKNKHNKNNSIVYDMKGLKLDGVRYNNQISQISQISQINQGLNKLTNLFIFKKYQNFADLYNNLIEYNQIKTKDEKNVLNKFMEIFQLEGLKIFTNSTENILKKHFKRHSFHFMRNFILFEKNLTIIKRKKFVYLHKLLVLRNLFLDANIKSHKFMKRIYFRKWSNMISSKKFQKKNQIMIMRNLVSNIEKKSAFKKINQTKLKSVIFNLIKEVSNYKFKKESFLLKSNVSNSFERITNIFDRTKLNNYKVFFENLQKRIKIYSQSNKLFSVFLLHSLNLDKTSVDKRILKYFNLWKFKTEKCIKKHKITCNLKYLRNLDKYQITKFSNMLQIFKLKFMENFNYFLNQLYLRGKFKYESNFLNNNLFKLENKYNHFLLNCIKGIYKLKCIENKKIKFITNVDVLEDNRNFYKNQIYNYWKIWTLKCTSISKLKNKIRSINKGISHLSFIYSRRISKMKILVFNCLNNNSVWKSDYLKIYKVLNIFQKLQRIFNFNLMDQKFSFLNNIRISSKINLDNKHRIHFASKSINKIFNKLKNSHFLNFMNIIKDLKDKDHTKLVFNHLSNIINILSCKLNSFSKHFLRCLKNNKKPKNKVDTNIVNNLSKINAILYKEMIKKQKIVNFSKILKKIYFLNINRNKNNQNYLNKDYYFSIWKNITNEEIKNEKVMVLTDIKNHQEFNGEIKLKIEEYTEATTFLENKITEVTNKAENCRTCSHILEHDSVNSMKSVNSLREDLGKMSSIPYMPVKFIVNDTHYHSEMTSNKLSLSNLEILEKIECKKSLKINKEELRGNLLRDSAIFISSNGLNLNFLKNTSVSATSNKEDDMIIFDENHGGLEYYNYLDKTVTSYLLSV